MSNAPRDIANAIGWTLLLAFGYARSVIGADSFLAYPLWGLSLACFGFSLGWGFCEKKKGGGK